MRRLSPPSTFAIPVVALALSAPVARADVKSVRVPHGGEVPDVALDAKGVLHLTYGKGLPGDAFYVRSEDGGQTFSHPAKLNRRANVVTTGGERGPKVAVGKGGVLHVVWLGYYKSGGGLWYTRSADGGKTFAPERKLNSPDYGLDNAALAADAEGNVVVLWTGGFPGAKDDPDSPTSSPIVLARSTDNGESFSKNEPLRSDHPASAHACGCCRLEARIAGDQLYVAFRGGYKNLRDPYLLVGPKAGNDFACVKVSDDRWDAECPMQGIPFQVDAKGRVLVSWMSRGQAFWAASDPGGKRFGEKSGVTSGVKNKEDYPLALANDRGEVLLSWVQGGRVRWARYGLRGGLPQDGGDLGPARGRHKHTAFVGADGHFYVVY